MVVSVDQPSSVYREQLRSLYHGYPLWEPSPIRNLYDQVTIGDVGYVNDEGFFNRLFNVTLPWNHPSNNRLGEPDHYKPLDWGPFANIREAILARGDYYSRNVSSQHNSGNLQAREPHDAEGVTYMCRGPGALLYLPHDAYREDVVRTKVFEDYIRDNVVSWFEWSKKMGLGVERMEDLILVSGRTLVSSWAAIAFRVANNTQEAEVSLAVRPHPNGEARFDWSKIHGIVSYHNSRLHPNNPSPTMNQCVFIRGFRAKRRLFWTMPIRAAAEPLPDDPDNSREDEIHVTQVPGAPKNRDPLIGVLDYIVERCQEDIIAVTHDNDLELIENVDTLTADAVERYLIENQKPVLVENGAAILNNDGPPVPDEDKAIFYAAAELAGEIVPLILHPALTKYFLTLEIGRSGSDDPEYDLPKEEMTSPAVHPPMPSLTLESHQGYPQLISVRPSDDSPGVGVTVHDVLRAIHEDMRKPSPRRAWNKLSNGERAVINASFKERCRTEEQLSKGPCRFDYLRGRDRLLIFPKLSADGTLLPPLLQFSSESVDRDESRVAGPSRSATTVG